MRNLSTALLACGLVLVAGACSRRSGVKRYSKVPAESAGDRTKWVPAAGKHLNIDPTSGSWDDSRRLTAGGGSRFAGLLFNLKRLPEGARVARAVLRLRRRKAKGTPRLRVLNVNRGLRVLRYADGNPRFGILRARLVSDKEEMLRGGYNDSNDAQVSGLALTAYPVECSIKSMGYRAGLFAPGKPYHQLLEKWNRFHDAGHRLAGAWDEIDVTKPALEQMGKDKQLLLGIKVSGGEIEWFALSRRSPWASPQLIVEFQGGVEAVTEAPPSRTPPPETGPKPRTEPGSKPPAGKGGIVVGSSPPRADVYINGKYVGTTPTPQLTFPAGEVKVRIEKKLYKSWERKVTVLAGNVVKVAPELEKK
jgi:hypothetical protein